MLPRSSSALTQTSPVDGSTFTICSGSTGSGRSRTRPPLTAAGKISFMLLIPCPNCGMERPEIEFRYGGEAHIARPADPGALADDEWANFLYFRANPKGVLAE